MAIFGQKKFQGRKRFQRLAYVTVEKYIDQVRCGTFNPDAFIKALTKEAEAEAYYLYPILHNDY